MSSEKRSRKARPWEFRTWRDFTTMNVSVGTMLHNRTGGWRFIRPIYEDKTPMCQSACPAGNDVEGWIRMLQLGGHEAAYRLLIREQPFPSVLGRVCFQFCQSDCNRNTVDSSVSIRELERHVGDFGRSVPVEAPPASHDATLAVVGAGPAGMTAAYFARLLGFRVTLLEKASEPGGLLSSGIPAYRLPRSIVDREFVRLQAMGIKLRTHTGVGSRPELDARMRDFDYVFLACGAQHSFRFAVRGGAESDRVMNGLTFLRRIAAGESVDPGRRVIVIGGGNTAIDAARTALRLGATVTVLYRRTEAEMPAHPQEVREAREEGVQFRFGIAPSRIERAGDGLRVVCCAMTPGPPDSDGRCRPIPQGAVQQDIEADTVLSAVGQAPALADLDIPHLRPGIAVETGADLRVDLGDESTRLYAGGDLLAAPRTVAHAVAGGKRAAIAMDCHRRGLDFNAVAAQIRLGDGPGLSFAAYTNRDNDHPVRLNRHKVAGPEEIVADYFPESLPVPLRVRSPEVRRRDFQPYVDGFTAEEIVQEADRCLHCGRCTECDNCRIFCPDVSILPRDGDRFGYVIDDDYCKGCAICCTECPRGAMSMVDEETNI